MSGLQEKLNGQSEWNKAILYDQNGKIIASTFTPLDGEVAAWLQLYQDRNTSIGKGIILLNEQYDIHRYHDPLIYGRRGDSAKGEGEGIAVFKHERNGTITYGLITYEFPILSAKAVPDLQAFCNTNL